MKRIFLMLVIVCSNNVYSQSEKVSVLNDTITISSECIVLYPDEEAEFIGGAAALHKYIIENIEFNNFDFETYSSKIYFEFIVDTDGSILNPNINNGHDNDLNERNLTLIENMPKWKPAKTNGKAVKSLVRIPININLN